MTNRNIQQTAIILTFSILIGLITGMMDTLFGRVLLIVSDLRTDYWPYLIPFLALAGVFITFLYQKWGSNAQKGMTLVFEVGHGSNEKIPKRLVPFIMVTTWLTHLFGGSAGREGVAVQIGATISHQFEHYFPKKNPTNMALLVGIAAGFAGLFQTPLAASFFAIEVLVVGHYSWNALIPCLLAAYTASTTSHFLGLEKFQHHLTVPFALTVEQLFKLLTLGIIFALIGNGFAIFLHISKRFLAQKLPTPYIRIAVTGVILSLAIIFIWQGRYAGLGTNLIIASLEGQTIYFYDWFFKLILTVLTLAAGFQGGEVTPLFAIGASVGAAAAGLLGLPLELAAALGYISVFGAATNTLLAPIFIGIEVFGWQHAPVYLLLAVISSLFHRKHSIYGAQRHKKKA